MGETCERCGYFRCRCGFSSYENNRPDGSNEKKIRQLQAENKQLKQALQNEKDKTAGKCIDTRGHSVDVPKGSFFAGVTFEDDY